MRRLLTFTLAIISLAFAALPAQASIKSEAAKAFANPTGPQISIRFGQPRRYRHRYYNATESRVESRIVRHGWRTYRETYRVMYYPDGETRTELISRERVG